MTKEERKALLEHRLKVITERNRGSYGVIRKLKRKLLKENF